MMNLRELEELVSQGEGQHLEFKQRATFPEKIVREMVAFANARGGYLLIGVSDDGNITGLKHAEEERFVIDKAIKIHSRPPVRCQSDYIPITKKRGVLLYTIFENRKKPGYYRENPDKRGKAYIRVNDKSIQASREVVEILKHSRANKSQPVLVGNNEQLLFKHIERHGNATLREFMKIADLSRNRASRILVNLVVSNILKIQTGEKDDYFYMNTIQ